MTATPEPPAQDAPWLTWLLEVFTRLQVHAPSPHVDVIVDVLRRLPDDLAGSHDDPDTAWLRGFVARLADDEDDLDRQVRRTDPDLVARALARSSALRAQAGEGDRS